MKTSIAMKLLLCGGIVLGVAGAYALHRGSTAAAPAASDAARSAPSSAPAAASRQRAATLAAASAANVTPATIEAQGCAFKRGDTAAWELSSEETAVISAADLGAAPGARDVTKTAGFTATLQVQALTDSRPEGTVLVARLSDVDQHGLQTTGDLTPPFLVRVGWDCAPAGFARLKSTMPLAARAQQATIHELWFRRPAGAQSPTTGSNGTGAFRAVMYAGSDARGPFVQRHITQYSKLWAGTGLSSKASVGVSRLTVRLGGTPWFTEMEGVEELSGGASGSARETLRVSPQAVQQGLFESDPKGDDAYIWEDLLPKSYDPVAGTEPTPEQQAQEKAVQGFTLHDEEKRLAARIATHADLDAQQKELATWFDAHPEGITEFARALGTRQVGAAARPAIYVAMGKARSTKARDALVRIQTNPGMPAIDRINAAIALTGRGDVDMSVAESLAADARAMHPRARGAKGIEYNRNALLVLGMMGARQSGRLPGVADLAKRTALAQLAGAATAADASPAFGALGNLGDVSLLSVAETYSNHPDPDMRAHAATILRRMPPAEVSSLVVTWLHRETSPSVKRSLYEVYRRMLWDAQEQASPDLVAQAALDLPKAPFTTTRQSIIHILGPLAATSPTAKAALLAQIPTEIRSKSGLYSEISQFVRSADVAPVLNAMPEFHHSNTVAGQP